MIDWIKRKMVESWIGSISRHLTQLIGPWLLATEIDPELVQRFLSDLKLVISWVAVYMITQGWSLKAHKASKN